MKNVYAEFSETQVMKWSGENKFRLMQSYRFRHKVRNHARLIFQLPQTLKFSHFNLVELVSRKQFENFLIAIRDTHAARNATARKRGKLPAQQWNVKGEW